jgi:uncharacterized surface protein with fasciclin (FAS1) repeats
MTYTRRKLLSQTAVVSVSALTSFPALQAWANQPAQRTIVELAAATPSLSILSKLIGDAGLAETLNGTGPFTVFAPSDDAFKALPAANLAALAGDKTALSAVLRYHVLAAKAMASDIQNGNNKSVHGANLALSKAGSFVTVEDAVVQQADIVASNGVVHIIDRVLMPPRT